MKSDKFVGGGVNKKTAAKPEYARRKSMAAGNYTAQAEQFVKSAPEPFRNPDPNANPNPLPPQQSGGVAYKPFHGSRVSVSDGFKKVNVASASKNVSPVGITGSQGRGSENGKVAGLGQPRRAGSPHNQGGMAQKKATKPSFYGR